MTQVLIWAEDVVDGDARALEEVALTDDLPGILQSGDGKEDSGPATPLIGKDLKVILDTVRVELGQALNGRMLEAGCWSKHLNLRDRFII